MKQKNTDRARRRRQAVLSALANGCLLLMTAGALLWARRTYFPAGPLSVVLLFLAAADAVSIVPLAVLLRARLKEIQGGELDEARQY